MNSGPILKRRLAGKIAKLNGEQFEQILNPICSKDQIALIRIPDGCRQVRTKLGLKIIRVLSPFDFFAAHQGKIVCFDTKSTRESNFFYSKINFNQVAELSKLNKQGIKSGYLIRFQKLDEICFADIKLIESLQFGQSIKPEDCLNLGTFFNFSLKKLFN